MLKQLLPALRFTLLFSLLTGLAYPLLVTGLSQLLFPEQANGTLVEKDGHVVGSQWIGQDFTMAKYFHARPSAAGTGYDARASSGSNLGPTSRKLIERVKTSEAQFRMENPDFVGLIPSDALTASGSGLDPHISPATAQAQVNRVASSRHIDVSQVQRLVDQYTETRTLGIFGEPRVNVVRLNIALDQQIH
jgi:K+-transporting ATPase ATPase C chain